MCVKNTKVFEEFKLLQNKIVNLTNDSRDRYYIRIFNKLEDSHVFRSAYWLIFLKGFLNNKKSPIIPPLFHGNNFVTHFTKKAQLFSSYFAKQCTAINNGSSLPSKFLLTTNTFLSNISFPSDYIRKMI